MFEKKNTPFKAVSRSVPLRSYNHNKTVSQGDLWSKIISTQSLVALGLSTLATVVCLVIYQRTLAFPFQFDDLLNITKNFSIRNIDLKLSLFTSPRWIGELSNKLNFKLGHFCPWSYRLINLITHLLSGTVFGAIVWKLAGVKDWEHKENFLNCNRGILTGFCTAFFLLHPVQSQTVNYAIQARLEGLAALFSLLGILSMLFYCTNKSTKAHMFLMLSCVLGFLSCGTKEIVIVAPILSFLIDLFFIAKFDIHRIKDRLVGHLLNFLVVFGTITYYMGPTLVYKMLSFGHCVKNNRGNIISAGIVNKIEPFPFLISEFKVILHYVWIFFAPWTMSVEYDYKLLKSALDTQVWLPLLALILITAGFVYLARKFDFGKLALFGWTWFLLALAPRASVIPCAELVGDYKTYLASCGMFLAISAVILGSTQAIGQLAYKLTGKNVKDSANSACFFVLLLTMAIGLDRRNNVWSDQELFWSDIVAKTPNKARAHNNLAVTMCEKGKFKESVAHLQKAISLDGFYPDPWSNLAVSFSMLGKPQEAIQALEHAIGIMPNYPEAYNNIGAILIGCGEFDKAIAPLQKAIELRPHYGKAYLNLGRAMGKNAEKKEEAWECFKKATELDLDSIEGYVVLGNESIGMGKFDQASDAFEKAYKLGERSKGVLMNLAGCYCQTGKLEQGLEMFKTIYNADKSDQSIAYNLALCFDMKGDSQSAAEVVKTLKFDQNCPEHAINLASKCIEKVDGMEEAKKFMAKLLESNTLDEGRKKLAQSQLQRIALQEKINSGGGVITGKDFNEIFGTSSQEEVKA